MVELIDLLPKSVNYEKIREARKFATIDLAQRLGTISPDRLFLNGFPAKNPVAVFNPTLTLEGDYVLLYPRIIIGYYKYVSAIVEARVPLEDILSGHVNLNVYSSSLAVMPSNEYDLWGAEDPRVYAIDNHLLMTYTGRTISYFSPEGVDRTLPITAVRRNGSWEKVLVHKPFIELDGKIINDKNAFIILHKDHYYFFHRPLLISGEHVALISKLPVDDVEEAINYGEGTKEVRPVEEWLALPQAPFEEKIAWGPPPIHLKGDEFLAIMHGVGISLQAYRIFAVILELPPDEPPIVKAVTPTYIMEPREPYEIFGDRPYTIFPCGVARYKEFLLLSYGAADYMAAFAALDYETLLSHLDEGRLE